MAVAPRQQKEQRAAAFARRQQEDVRGIAAAVQDIRREQRGMCSKLAGKFEALRNSQTQLLQIV
eukprot:SAG22_NODE_7927_length_697_cov_0.637124_2_plen_63_part_01